MAVCVWQPTPRTADVTVTKIAGYVRVCILMNRWWFFVFLAFILFTLRPLCWIYEYAWNEHVAHWFKRPVIGLCTHGITTMLVVSLRARWMVGLLVGMSEDWTREKLQRTLRKLVDWLTEWLSQWERGKDESEDGRWKKLDDKGRKGGKVGRETIRHLFLTVMPQNHRLYYDCAFS